MKATKISIQSIKMINRNDTPVIKLLTTTPMLTVTKIMLVKAKIAE